jgi:hypothetical protein
MRPVGEVAMALQRAASVPGTVVELAHRAQVGMQVARYTASRMVDRQQLLVLDSARPAVLAAPGAVPAGRVPATRPQAPALQRNEELARTLDLLTRSFWERDPAAPP